MIQLQQQLENKLKLPVVVTQSGTIFVLDAFGRGAEVFRGGAKSALDKRTNAATSPKIAAFLQQGNRLSRGPLYIRLLLRYPDVTLAAAGEGLRKIGADATSARGIHIRIDAGSTPAEWSGLERFIAALLSNIRSKYRIPAGITIDGALARPDKRHVNWLTTYKIVVRYVLGPALGYAGDIDTESAKTLKAMSDDGLRVPVLFYWSGQNSAEVRDVLNKALRLNRFGGIGILPHFLSPAFDCRNMHVHNNPTEFSQVVGSLYADRLLCEYLEEPINDIEQRLAGAIGAHCVRGLITEDGNLLSFRYFPFAAHRKLRRAAKSLATKFNAPVCGRCRRCAWRHICGGVDASPREFRRQYKIITDAWCEHRKILMQRIVGECLEIRENLHHSKNLLLKSCKI